jgi:hypothetical protein
MMRADKVKNSKVPSEGGLSLTVHSAKFIYFSLFLSEGYFQQLPVSAYLISP